MRVSLVIKWLVEDLEEQSHVYGITSVEGINVCMLQYSSGSQPFETQEPLHKFLSRFVDYH